PDAEWMRQASFFAWAEVSTLSIGDGYAQSLLAVAGPAPALEPGDAGIEHMLCGHAWSPLLHARRTPAGVLFGLCASFPQRHTALYSPLPLADAGKGHGWPCFEERGRGAGGEGRLVVLLALSRLPPPAPASRSGMHQIAHRNPPCPASSS